MTHRSLILSLAVAIGLSALLGACSSTPQRPEGHIDILTTAQGQPLSGAECTVDTGAGSWRVVTPAVAEVGQARGDLRVVCNRAGFRTSEVLIRGGAGGGAYAPGGTSVGIGVGGGTWGRHSGVGISLGFGFPLSGGSRQRYPTQVIVDMTPLPAGQPVPQPVPQPIPQPIPQPTQPVPQPVPQQAPQNKSP